MSPIDELVEARANEPMGATDAARVLEDMEVHGWRGVYVLGCLDRRVTLYSQQVRALNLAAALFAAERVKQGHEVVVVGAGAAGLTCAAGLRQLGAKVTVLEEQREILSVFRGGSKRWLHPGVYDWPREGWSRDRAGLPLLDWEQGTVDVVCAQLEAGWGEIVAKGGIEVCCGVPRVQPGSPGDSLRTVTWTGQGKRRTHTVILAVGFGLEPTELPTERGYWEGDDLDAPRLDARPRKWLVSGCGDGALTDLLRLCIRGFQHDRMLSEFVQDPRMRDIRAEIRRIESNAAIQDDRVRLHDEYERLDAPWVVEAMTERRRTDTDVTLASPTAEFLTRDASALNRFLVAQLFRARLFEPLQGMVEHVDADGDGVRARFSDGHIDRFDRIVRRHGPRSALAMGFPKIAEAIERDRIERRRKPTWTDQTRERFWREGVFGPETRKWALERYLETLERLHHDLHLAGFETRVRFPVALDELHVPLRAIVRRRREGEEDEQRKVREIALADAFRVADEQGMRGVVLLGHPGAGKTTHLKQVLLKVVRDGPESIGLPAGMVPVFLPLRQLRDLRVGLRGLVEQQLDSPVFDVAPGFGARTWQQGKLLLLLDGLDELADATERREVARWIREACAAAGDNRFVVTCRFAGYTDDAQLGERFLALELWPMDDGQVETFVRRWYASVERATGGDEQRAELEAEHLLAALRRPEMSATGVYEMTHNPLLLTTICVVHRDRGELPRERVVLYEEAVAVLLEWWRRVFKELPVTFPTREARLVLQPVAEWMHRRQKRQATAGELVEVVSEGLALMKRGEVSAREFLATIRDESGLLNGLGIDEFGFTHLGFQEYLTARSLRARAFDEPEVLVWLAERFEETWWQEVILLLLADGDPAMFRRFMGAVCERPELPRWAGSEMMDRCFDEAFGVTPAPFVELLRRRDGEDPLLVERQAAAAGLLARKLPSALEGLELGLREHPVQEVRRWAPVGQEEQLETRVVRGVELVLVPGGPFMMGSPASEEDRDVEEQLHEVTLDRFWLARTPVTNAQYAEYLEANPRAQKPELWGDRRFNQPRQPVVGVSWEDAMAYCEWAGLTLPTEAQWERACRAGTTTRFWSGDDDEDLARVGWFAGSSGGRLHAVGELEPSPFGLYDMHGNVWEWCLDAHGSYETRPRGSDGLRHAPVGGADRVVRGGSFDYGARYARSAARSMDGPSARFVIVGFRPARGDS